MDREEIFPNDEAYRNVTRGFYFMEMAHPEWLFNFYAKYGPSVAFKLDPDDDTLTGIIRSSGNIRKFLSELIHDDGLLAAVRPDKYFEMGMLDQWSDGYELYSETWAMMIKAYLTQGINVMERLSSGGLNSAVDVDVYDHMNDRYESVGNHRIDKDKLKEMLGPEGMAALHILFHAISLDDFHDFLAEPPEKIFPESPIDSMIILSRDGR